MVGRVSRLRQWLSRIGIRGRGQGAERHRHPVSVDDVERVRRQYQESEQRFRALLESLPKVAVQGYDRDRRVIYWNEASTKLYGYSADEASGMLLEDLIIPDEMRGAVVKAHQEWVTEGKNMPAAEELELQHHSGERVSVFSHHVMLGEHTEFPLMFCIDVDLSDQKRAHRDLAFVTHFDTLTHLPNRNAFEIELEQVLEGCRQKRAKLAVIYLDIDHFSEINDTLGYEQGNRLLVELSQRLRQEQNLTELISRVASDEFVLACPGLEQLGDAHHLVDRVQQALRRPFVLNGGERRVTAALGVSLFPDNGLSARELIRNAHVAKNRAKLEGPGELQFFQQHHHDELIHQQRMVERLEQAIEHRELSLYYQPQVSVVSGRIENFEALLRWQPRDADSCVSPGEFIPLAERSGLIHRLGDWVMEEACRQQAIWRRDGFTTTRVDINLSGHQMLRPDSLARFEACLERHGLGPGDIGVELTENVLIEASSSVLEDLRRLYHRGIRIAIDDFGTGYSSLSYLKHFPVSALKIDRTFISDAPSQPKDRAIMEAAIFIGHRLGLEVVAEGVESVEQLALIREMHCDLAQGFFFYRPMPASDIRMLLDNMSGSVS